jgi:hypothetical protein
MSAQIKNETGNRYGRLLVLEKMPHKKGEEQVRWRCRCDCGKERIAFGWLLRIGKIKSCGCLSRETVRYVNETGNRYGRLLVLEKIPQKKGEYPVRWRCRCGCGKETIVSGSALRSNNTKSCGCRHRGAVRKNEAGKRYGKWLVLEEAPREPDGWIRWLCRCDCGTERAILGYQLRRGNSTSCGCGQQKANDKPVSKDAREKKSHANTIDEAGHKYGRLLVVKKSSRRINGQVCWRCLCDCGKYITVSGDALRKGRATSCGCREKKGIK